MNDGERYQAGKFLFCLYKSELVLQDIDLEIKKGSFTVVAGPSGAGKTTLCKAMTGIVPFYMGGRYSGDVQVLGESTKGRRVSDIAMRVGADAGGLRKPAGFADRGRGSCFQFAESRFCAGGGGGAYP